MRGNGNGSGGNSASRQDERYSNNNGGGYQRPRHDNVQDGFLGPQGPPPQGTHKPQNEYSSIPYPYEDTNQQ